MKAWASRFRQVACAFQTNQQGLIVEVVVAGVVTLLILTATGWAVLSNKPSCAAALQRLDNNTATAGDMQKIQQCTKDAARTVQILGAGGGLVGSGGPIPSTGAAGVVDTIIKGAIDDEVGRASTPAPTKDNPLPNDFKPPQRPAPTPHQPPVGYAPPPPAATTAPRNSVFVGSWVCTTCTGPLTIVIKPDGTGTWRDTRPGQPGTWEGTWSSSSDTLTLTPKDYQKYGGGVGFRLVDGKLHDPWNNVYVK